MNVLWRYPFCFYSSLVFTQSLHSLTLTLTLTLIIFITLPPVGVNVKTDIEGLKTEVPHIVVGTPGRILDLATKRNVLDLSKVCDNALL